MIDPTTDVMMPLNDARQIIPVARDTLHRWATKGVDGIVLETLRVGRCRYTTRKAVAEFMRACDAAAQPPEPAPRKKPTRRLRPDREAQILEAERKLDEMGIK